MQIGKYAAILALALTISPIYALSDKCSADAEISNYHPIRDNNYLFALNVRAAPCDKYGCHGWVRIVIRYHYKNVSGTLTNSTNLSYDIHAGNSQAHVSQEHWVGSVNSEVFIDDVGVAETSCSTP